MKKINLKSPSIRIALGILLVGALGVALWTQTIYKDQQNELTVLQKKRETKQNNLNSILAMKPQLKKLQIEVEQEVRLLDSLKSIFPDQKEVPRLIREITMVARMSDIATTKFTPQPDVQKEYYIENKYNMSVSGGFHQLANFYSYFSNMQLIINLTNVSMKVNPKLEQMRKENEEKGMPFPTLDATFQMTTFSSKK
jgi:type IV pilus assembly protein PilO